MGKKEKLTKKDDKKIKQFVETLPEGMTVRKREKKNK